jgi:formiminoglutamase
MSNPVNSQSQKRRSESLVPLFEEKSDADLLILKSSSDIGVIRNGGRNGARYAPQSLLATFKKLTQSTAFELSMLEKEVSSPEEESADFANAQLAEADRIRKIHQDFPQSALIHIGGGHDHIYPLLKSFEAEKKIVVLNIDAHADTRTDEEHHSGTPFRQFAREFQGEFHLFQIGLHPFANSFSTLSELEKGETQILWREEMRESGKIEKFFQEIKKVSENSLVIFSLDADALAGENVPGVSAVNGSGLTPDELLALWKRYLSLTPKKMVLGIYELNPVYDSLSSLSMRTISAFLYQALSKK